MVIQFRRGSPTPDYVLLNGEPGWDHPNKILKVGDGNTPWASLPAINLPYIPSELIEETVNAYLETHPVSVGVEFVQVSPLASWTIPHNLGRKPSVCVYVDGEEVLADVSASNSSVTISFASPQVGTATLI